MPRVIRTVIFTRDETRTLAAASRFTDIAFPLASDPLVQRSSEALARAVQDDDQRRRALISITSPHDQVSYPRLRAAQMFLAILIEQMIKESEIKHWLDLSATPDHPQSRQMAEVLAAERIGQQRTVREAIEIIDAALALVSADDDPRPSDRRTDYGGFGNPIERVYDFDAGEDVDA